ncbi:uncharacterized protein [Prorops nasuta]|uniref:uncharacterized protein n=1 Tax=Prorops nasuta TaxID=863751 RepID=UPI0034CD1C23
MKKKKRPFCFSECAPRTKKRWHKKLQNLIADKDAAQEETQDGRDQIRNHEYVEEIMLSNDAINVYNDTTIEENIINNEFDNIEVKGIVICGMCDLPAKALFLNMIQYNGKFGCQKCYQKGERYLNVQVYPFENFKVRDEKETLMYVKQSMISKFPVYGVKGPTMISSFTYKYIRTTTVDSMHCVFEGVVKSLLHFWLDSKFHCEQFSIHNKLKMIDERLLNIKPPNFVQRYPRKLLHLKYWKANELKNFFFFYSLPILEDILDSRYFNHFKLLVFSISLLMKSQITEENINISISKLKKFVKEYEQLYGKKFMTCNVHSLLHLPQCAIDFGPLWVTSCFPMEDINGKVKRLIHGSKEPQIQICNKIFEYSKLFTFLKNNSDKSNELSTFYTNLNYKTARQKLTKLSSKIFIIGTIKKYKLTHSERTLFQNFNISGNHYCTFKKLLHQNDTFVANDNKRKIKRESSYCTYISHDKKKEFGQIQNFIKISNCTCERHCTCGENTVMIVQKLEVIPAFCTDYINLIIRKSDSTAVNV